MVKSSPFWIVWKSTKSELTIAVGGYCGSCKVKLTAGKVKWVQDSLVPLEDDEILVCCCVPDGSIKLAI